MGAWLHCSSLIWIHFLQFSKIDTDIILDLLAAFLDESYSNSYSLDENQQDQYNNG